MISAEAAAKLMATVSDCRVSQVVNVKKGIHCLNPKNVEGQARTWSARSRRRSATTSPTSRTPTSTRRWTTRRMAMIKFLEKRRKIARLDAYGLASVAMDCRVGAVSESEKNVHCLMPKSLWQRPK